MALDETTIKHVKDFLTDEDSDEEVLAAILAVIVGAMSAELAIAGSLVNTTLDLDQLVANWSTTLASRVSSINRLTANTVADIIASGIKDEASLEQIIADVERLFASYGRTRAITIARTEILGATNYTAFNVYTAAGTPFKRWVAIIDERTRDSHASTHEQLRPMPEPFDVQGVEMMFPGDPSAPAKEVVNCRCVVLPEYMPDRSIWSVEKTKHIVNSYDMRYLRGVSELTSNMRGVFQRQLESVLRFL